MALSIQLSIGLDPSLLPFWNEVRAQLNRIEAALIKEGTTMAALDDQIATLTNQVNTNTTVIGSAKTLIDGFAAQLATAVANAQSAGATPAQLQALNDLQTAVKANDDDLAAAVAANTPASSGTAPKATAR